MLSSLWKRTYFNDVLNIIEKKKLHWSEAKLILKIKLFLKKKFQLPTTLKIYTKQRAHFLEDIYKQNFNINDGCMVIGTGCRVQVQALSVKFTFTLITLGKAWIYLFSP